MLNTTFSKNLIRNSSQSYIKYRGFDFVKYVELLETGVRFKVMPINSEEIIYTCLIIDTMFLEDLELELENALDEWINETTSELERVFVKLKDM